MKHKLTTSLLLLHPLLIWFLFLTMNLQYSWHTSHNEQIYDLGYNLFSFILFSVGVGRLLTEGSRIVILFLCFMFFSYQYLAFMSFKPLYTKILRIDSSTGVVLKRKTVGVLADDRHDLLVYKRHAFLFIKVKRVKSFENVKLATLSYTAPNSVTIRYLTHGGENYVDLISIRTI